MTVGARLVDALVAGTGREEPVVRYAEPQALHEAFRAHVGLDIGRNEAPHDPAQALLAIEDILARAVRSGHPRFFNQNWAGADPVAVLGDWMTALLNTTAATYEVAPIFTLMENELLARLAELAGLADSEAPRSPRLVPGEHGLFAPGGAVANLYALHLARTHATPEAVDYGQVAADRLVAFVSEQSHYSFSKASALLGLGRRRLVEIACDEAGRMRVDALEDAIRRVRAEGQRPFFVGATAGTTVTGGFDPIEAIAEVAEREALWLHVDGAYGGTALFSERHRHLLEGVHRARSLSWNPHKMMGMTQQCAVLLVRDRALLRRAFAAGASYIFQVDKNDADQDLGDLTFQCGRRSDGLKLWLTWKVRGERWFGERVDRAVGLAEALEARLAEDDRFCLAHPRTFANVGFWWVPRDLRPLDPRSMTPGTWARLHGLAPRIKDAMQREGVAMVGYQPLGGRPNFFRFLVMSPDVSPSDLETTLEMVDRLGEKVETGSKSDRHR